MAKILVADDNSNIQKMVGLALKGQGIDVVAVGNGEAAVRKISDVRPDLVLADVFMPVRNGYEVCQFVKADSALSHIPVILLVGAFDPLDEQEAQRVGADGVLKKPFVPPDPLIAMVKSALQRAGVAHGGEGAAKAPEPEALRATDLLSPSSATLPTLESLPMTAASSQEPVVALENESFVDELPERREPVRIDTGAQPVAFGSLLETPAAETEEDQELGYGAPVNSELAIEHDWQDGEREQLAEEEEEEKPVAPWRRDEAETGSKSAGESRANDWRAGSFEQIRARKTPLDSWETADEKPELVEMAPASKANVKEAPAATASQLEDTTVISATAFAKDAWASTISQASQELASKEPAMALQEVAPAREEKRVRPEAVVTSAPEVKQAETDKKEKKEPKDSWFSVTSSPWDAEIQKANRLASTWDAAVPVPAAPGASNGNEKAAETTSETTKAVIEEAALPAAAVEAIREEAAQVAEDLTPGSKPIAEKASPVARQSAVETAAPNMDELVAKVLAKMSPDLLQAVTRELLKPVVEAMVKEEMKAKKS